MNSRLKENSLIFSMALVLTNSGGQIKIRFFSGPESQPQVKVDKNLQMVWV